MTRLLNDSPLVERLGWVLLHSVWQFAAVGAVLFVALLVLRRAAAMARYTVGLLALGVMVAAPAATWVWLPHWTEIAQPVIAPPDGALQPPLTAVMPAAEALPTLTAMTPETMSVAAEASQSGLIAGHLERTVPWDETIERRLRPWLPSVVLAWCLGVLAFALRPLLSWRRLRGLRRNGLTPVPADVETRFRGLMQRLGVRRGVSLVQSALVQVPVVVGYLRPAVLLPVSVLAELPPLQLEAILAHELAHVRRHDFLVNLVQTLVETVFFYHPAVWWVSRQIRNEREHCCDDLAVGACGDRSEYGRALLALEEMRGVAPALSVGAGGGSLVGRIRRLLVKENGNLSPGLGAAGGVAVLLALLLLAGVWSVIRANTRDAAADGPALVGGEVMSANEQAAWDALEELPLTVYGVDRGHQRRHLQLLERTNRPNADQLADLRKQIAQPVRSADLWQVPAEAWPLVGELKSLRRLGIVASDMRGEVFQQIAELRDLQRLEVVNSQCLPPDFAQLQSSIGLEHIDVMFSTFEESSARRQELIGELTDAERAWSADYGMRHPGRDHQIEAAILTDRMLEQLAGLTRLKTLKVINSAVSERGVAALAGMTQLKALELQCIDLTPEAAGVIGSLPSLRSFRYANATDETLAEFSKLRQLEDLDLWAGDVTDEGVQRLLPLTSLQRLALRGSRISDAGLLELANLPALTSLDLRHSEAITAGGVRAFRERKPECPLLIEPNDTALVHDHDAPHRHETMSDENQVADGATAFKPFDCLLIDPATGEPLPGDGFTIHFLFKLPATADAPEDTIDNLIWGPKSTSRFQFLVPERSLKHPERDKLVVQWAVGHADYEMVAPPERVPLVEILRDDPRSARDTFRRIAMQRKKPQPDPQSSRIVVKYDIADAEPQTRIYVQDINGKGDIGTEEVGLSKFNPLENGGTLTLPDLDPGDYQVARYRQLEIGQVGPSRIHTGLYLDRRQFKLLAGGTKSIEFVRPGGQPVSGRVEGLKDFGLNKVIVCVCSANATDPESLNSLDVTIFDARHSDAEGRFTTERLPPGKYVILAEAYAPFKQEDLANTGIPVPRYVGTTKFTVPETGDAPSASVTLRDTQTPAAADANPPAKAQVVVHYDIPDAEPEARVFLQDLDRKLDIGSVVEGPMKWNPLRNGESLVLTDLEPGNYQVARRRLVEIGRVGNEVLRNSIYFDRRPFALAAGETKWIDITRPNGKPVTGRVARMKDLGVERVVVYACSDNATDWESPSRQDVTIFDVQPCDTEGNFVTERLSPGDYVLVVRGYTAIPPEVLSRTGDIPPRFVGTARVRVPEAGDPPAVEVTLEEARRPSGGAAKLPSRQSQAAAVAAIEKLGGEVQYDENNPDRPAISVRFFQNTKVTDADLAALKALTNLLEVVLTGTRVTDAGLAHLSGLTSLGMLDLTKTRVTDAGLVHLKDLSRLEYLMLQGTAVTDAGLAHVSGLDRLVMLSLGETRVTDAGLAHLKGLSGLYTLNLEGTRITDAGLEQLTGFSSLRDLRLSDTAITAAGLKHLSGLTNLNTLVLNSTKIGGDGMAHLQPLRNLEKLWLVKADVDDTGLEHLQGLTSLRELALGDKTRVTRAGVQRLQAELPECKILVSFPEALETSIRFNVFDQTGKQPLAQFRVIPGYRRMQGDLEQPTWQENDVRRGREGELLWPLADLLSEETAFLVEAEGYKPQVWTWIKKSEGPKDIYFQLVKERLGSLLLDCQLQGGAAEYAFHWNLSEPDEPRPGGSPESRDVKAANGRQTEFRNLIPGKYQLWRVRPVRFPDFTRNYGLDYREVQVAAGEQTQTRFVRGAGHRVRGRIVGLPELVGPFGGGGGEGPGQEHETLACVLVRAADAPDPETSQGDYWAPTFDAAPADPDGRFVTDPLEPGTYKLYAHAYRRLTEQERVRTGDILPSWAGSLTVTVPEEREPDAVEITLTPFSYKAQDAKGAKTGLQPGDSQPRPSSPDEAREPSKPDSEPAADDRAAGAALTVEAQFAEGAARPEVVARLWRRTDAEPNETIYDSDWFDPATRVLWREVARKRSQADAAQATRFAFEQVAPGEYRVSVHAWTEEEWSRADPSPFGASAPVTVGNDAGPLAVPVTITGDRTLIVKFVDAESHEPLDLVPITLFRSDGLPITTGNGNHGVYGEAPGRKTYRGLLPGKYAVRVFDRYEGPDSRIAYKPLPERVQVTIGDGAETTMEVAIPPERLTEQQVEELWPFWVYGRVTDEDGKPVPDADVTVSTGAGTLMQGGSGKTDADGRFKVHFVAGLAIRRSDAAPLGVGTQAAIVHVRREGFELKEPAEAAQLQMSDSPTEEVEDDATRRQVVRPRMPVELLFVLVRPPDRP